MRRELSHRVGNSLTVLSSIYRSCSRTAKTKEELDDIYLERLVAVAKANRLDVESAGRGALLTELIEAAIGIFPDRDRVTVSAASLMVQSDSVLPLTLVLNELATNTLKHRDMESGGRLVVRAELDHATDQLVLEWDEDFAPIADSEATKGTGFGTVLLRRMIEDQLMGSFDRLDDTGYRVVLRLPRVRLEGVPNDATSLVLPDR